MRPGHDEVRQDERNNDLVMPDRNRDTTRCRAPNSQGKYFIDALTWSRTGANKRSIVQSSTQWPKPLATFAYRLHWIQDFVCPECRRPTVWTPSPSWRPKHPGRLDQRSRSGVVSVRKKQTCRRRIPQGRERMHIRHRQRTGSCRKGRISCVTGRIGKVRCGHGVSSNETDRDVRGWRRRPQCRFRNTLSSRQNRAAVTGPHLATRDGSGPH